jgi:hypothetical protein
MDASLSDLQQQRDQALEQMRSIDRLRRGFLSRQFFKRQRGGQTVTQGPYFVLQSFLNGKKRSERVPAEQAAAVGEEVQNYQRFQALAERFVELTEQITRLAAETKDSKKNSRRRKLPPSVSGKPKRS